MMSDSSSDMNDMMSDLSDMMNDMSDMLKIARERYLEESQQRCNAPMSKSPMEKTLDDLHPRMRMRLHLMALAQLLCLLHGQLHELPELAAELVASLQQEMQQQEASEQGLLPAVHALLTCLCNDKPVEDKQDKEDDDDSVPMQYTRWHVLEDPYQAWNWGATLGMLPEDKENQEA